MTSRLHWRTAYLAIAVVVVLLAAACSPGSTLSERPEASGVQEITVEELHSMLQNKDFTLINVHIPFEGEIPGTDVHIPYNEIEQYTDLLPADKDAKIVLYCRSGSMSASASKVLAEMGYTNVFDFPGSMNGWKAAGYELLDRPSVPE